MWGKGHVFAYHTHSLLNEFEHETLKYNRLENWKQFHKNIIGGYI